MILTFFQQALIGLPYFTGPVFFAVWAALTNPVKSDRSETQDGAGSLPGLVSDRPIP